MTRLDIILTGHMVTISASAAPDTNIIATAIVDAGQVLDIWGYSNIDSFDDSFPACPAAVTAATTAALALAAGQDISLLSWRI